MGRDEAISCLSTGTTKSLYTSVSYFLFWHNQSSKLSRHDRIWQVPRTLAKLDKEEAVRCREGDELAWTLCLLSPLPVTWAGRVAWRGCGVGQNNPPNAEGDRYRESCRECGENMIKRGSHYTLNCGTVCIMLVTSNRVFPLSRLSVLYGCCSGLLGYLSSSPIWLIVLDRKGLIVISVLSVLISWVKPLSGSASVHVVKAIYEQWPDMKPRLLRPCKQPHLFEPTCSPVFTGPVNNEISPAYYYYCITNVAAAWTLH